MFFVFCFVKAKNTTEIFVRTSYELDSSNMIFQIIYLLKFIRSKYYKFYVSIFPDFFFVINDPCAIY